MRRSCASSAGRSGSDGSENVSVSLIASGHEAINAPYTSISPMNVECDHKNPYPWVPHIQRFQAQAQPERNILVGDNDAGKSTLMEAISLVLNGRIGGVLEELNLYI